MDVLKSYYEISPFFFTVTAAASLLYMTMNLLMIFGGDHGHDSSHHQGHDHFASDASFKFFTTQTILAFLMGFGWAGITCTVKWMLPMWQALIISVCFGTILMSFTAFLYYHVRKLNTTSSVNLYSALGAKASVYKQIPVSTDGDGEIQVVVSGSLRIVKAVSTEEAISSFSEVEVVGVKDQNTLIVRKIVKDTSNGESA